MSDLPKYIFFNPTKISEEKQRRPGAYQIYARTEPLQGDAMYKLIRVLDEPKEAYKKPSIWHQIFGEDPTVES